jgi:hypothetical protein
VIKIHFAMKTLKRVNMVMWALETKLVQSKGYGSPWLLDTVITPFLPPGFSRVSARKTRQPGPSRSDPTRARRIKYSQEEGPRHISQGLAKFD